MNKPVTLPDTSTAPEASALRGLFEPFEVKSLSLRNRFAMAPMTRAFSPDGIPGADVAEYYRRRAAGGVGLIITEGTYIPDPAAGPHTRVPRIYGDSSWVAGSRLSTPSTPKADRSFLSCGTSESNAARTRA